MWSTSHTPKYGGVGTTTTAIAGATLALATAASLATPAIAGPGPEHRAASGGSDRISVSGTCDAGSRWTLSGRSRYLRIDVEGRVDAQRRGKKSRWVLRLAQNQSIVAVTSKKSGGGGLKVKARVGSQPGTDTFTLTALNRSTGETCQGTLTF